MLLVDAEGRSAPTCPDCLCSSARRRRRLSRALALLGAWLVCCPAYAEWPDLALLDPVVLDIDGSKDAALIVGIEQYYNFPRIPGARTNAEDWYQFMRRSIGVQGRNIVILKNGDAVDYKIRTTLSDLVKKARKGARVWFVFIGHGAPSQKSGDGLLAGYDASATAEGLEQRSLHRSELIRQLGSRAKDGVTGIAIIDASFSGRTARGPLVEGLSPEPSIDTATPAHVTVMTAARSDELAGPLQDTHPLRPAFSYLMLGALRGWADANKDGRVTAREAVDYSADTLEATLRDGRVQHPTLDSSNKDFVLSDGTEPAPEFAQYPEANELVPEGRATPSHTFSARSNGAQSAEQDSAEPAAPDASETDEALVHGIGSVAVGVGGGSAYDAYVLFGEGAVGMRFGDYIRLTGVVLGAASNFRDTDTTSQNPSPRPAFGVSGTAGLGIELARTHFLSMSADALGGLTYLGEQCENPAGDGTGNLICDRVRGSEVGPAGGARLAMQVRVGRPEAGATQQGLLISGTALTSKPTGWFGGVFLGYGMW